MEEELVFDGPEISDEELKLLSNDELEFEGPEVSDSELSGGVPSPGPAPAPAQVAKPASEPGVEGPVDYSYKGAAAYTPPPPAPEKPLISKEWQSLADLSPAEQVNTAVGGAIHGITGGLYGKALDYANRVGHDPRAFIEALIDPNNPDARRELMEFVSLGPVALANNPDPGRSFSNIPPEYSQMYQKAYEQAPPAGIGGEIAAGLGISKIFAPAASAELTAGRVLPSRAGPGVATVTGTEGMAGTAALGTSRATAEDRSIVPEAVIGGGMGFGMAGAPAGIGKLLAKSPADDALKYNKLLGEAMDFVGVSAAERQEIMANPERARKFMDTLGYGAGSEFSSSAMRASADPGQVGALRPNDSFVESQKFIGKPEIAARLGRAATGQAQIRKDILTEASTGRDTPVGPLIEDIRAAANRESAIGQENTYLDDQVKYFERLLDRATQQGLQAPKVPPGVRDIAAGKQLEAGKAAIELAVSGRTGHPTLPNVKPHMTVEEGVAALQTLEDNQRKAIEAIAKAEAQAASFNEDFIAKAPMSIKVPMQAVVDQPTAIMQEAGQWKPGQPFVYKGPKTAAGGARAMEDIAEQRLFDTSGKYGPVPEDTDYVRLMQRYDESKGRESALRGMGETIAKPAQRSASVESPEQGVQGVAGGIGTKIRFYGGKLVEPIQERIQSRRIFRGIEDLKKIRAKLDRWTGEQGRFGDVMTSSVGGEGGYITGLPGKTVDPVTGQEINIPAIGTMGEKLNAFDAMRLKQEIDAILRLPPEDRAAYQYVAAQTNPLWARLDELAGDED